MPFFDFSLEALAKAGLLSLIGSVIAGILWMLAQKEILGFRTLMPGDRGFRSVFGRPTWYFGRCGSHFFIKDVWDVEVVSTYNHVHDPVIWTYGEGVNKIQLMLWIESAVTDSRTDVQNAIYILSDSKNCRKPQNKRTLRAERLVRDALTEAAYDSEDGSAKPWREIDLEAIKQVANEIFVENGSHVPLVRLTDPSVSEGALISKGLSRQ